MGKDKHKHKDKKRDKELAKLHETDEEKRARRLAKKAAKAAKAEEESQVGGYSNHANPWNDPNLSEQFVWGKKVDKDRSRGIDESSSKEAQKRKRQELQVELEKVKRAREQREIDKEQWEEERRLLDREREQMAFADYQKREDDFQLEQSQVRARKRVQEGRAKPIDMLADSLQLLSETIQPAEALEMRLQVSATGLPYRAPSASRRPPPLSPLFVGHPWTHPPPFWASSPSSRLTPCHVRRRRTRCSSSST